MIDKSTKKEIIDFMCDTSKVKFETYLDFNNMLVFIKSLHENKKVTK